jgi:hypothetical protein
MPRQVPATNMAAGIVLPSSASAAILVTETQVGSVLPLATAAAAVLRALISTTDFKTRD